MIEICVWAADFVFKIFQDIAWVSESRLLSYRRIEAGKRAYLAAKKPPPQAVYGLTTGATTLG